MNSKRSIILAIEFWRKLFITPPMGIQGLMIRPLTFKIRRVSEVRGLGIRPGKIFSCPGKFNPLRGILVRCHQTPPEPGSVAGRGTED